jgi:hypothetical protein
MKVGTYTIPDIKLFPSLVEATKLIYDKYPTEEISDMKILANLLGHKTDRSGTYLNKMTCLRAYGLIEGRGTVKVSEIGKKITYSADETERMQAIEKALLNIPLWKEFFTRWGVNLPNGNFWVDLAKIANLEAPQAQALAETVRKAYLDDFRYLHVPKKEEKPLEKPPETEESRGAGLLDATKIETEDFAVYVKRNLESIKSFETFDFKGWLTTLKSKLQKEKKE